MRNDAISVSKTIRIKMPIKVSMYFSWLIVKVGFKFSFQAQFRFKKVFDLDYN